MLGDPGVGGQNPDNGGYIRYTDVVAVADEESGWVIQKNKFILGETLWVLSPQQEPYPITVESMENADGEAIETAPHAEMRVRIGHQLPPHAILRRERRSN